MDFGVGFARPDLDDSYAVIASNPVISIGGSPDLHRFKERRGPVVARKFFHIATMWTPHRPAGFSNSPTFDTLIFQLKKEEIVILS